MYPEIQLNRYLCVAMLVFLYLSCSNDSKIKETKEPVRLSRSEYIEALGIEALKYCKNNNYDSNLCFLLDMGAHSGKKRFFVWDFIKRKAILSGLVSHGCCNNPWGTDKSKSNPVFSNSPESHCTSLGKYKIGNSFISEWGIKKGYQLIGLEKTNSNALRRQIVLHSWDDIPEKEPFPEGIPEGWGCPAVSNSFMKTLDSLIIDSEKPILLWIFR